VGLAANPTFQAAAVTIATTSIRAAGQIQLRRPGIKYAGQ
jgi:hypothetical protein